MHTAISSTFWFFRANNLLMLCFILYKCSYARSLEPSHVSHMEFLTDDCHTQADVFLVPQVHAAITRFGIDMVIFLTKPNLHNHVCICIDTLKQQHYKARCEQEDTLLCRRNFVLLFFY